VAFAVAWVFAALAAPLFALSPALRYFRAEPDADRHLLGPLTEPRLLVVFLVSFLITFTFGLMEVGYPAFGAQFGVASMGAVLIAVNSAASAIGGLAYGGMRVPMSAERLLPRLLLLMVVPLGAHALAGSAWILAPLAFVAGLLIAPSLTIVMQLVSQRAPAQYTTEAFTWSSTCIVGGVGAGAAIGGKLAEAWGPPALFVLAAASILLAALVASGPRARGARIS
jgi:predicted MFS family arabinose efflux permease